MDWVPLGPGTNPEGLRGRCVPMTTARLVGEKEQTPGWGTQTLLFCLIPAEPPTESLLGSGQQRGAPEQRAGGRAAGLHLLTPQLAWPRRGAWVCSGFGGDRNGRLQC